MTIEQTRDCQWEKERESGVVACVDAFPGLLSSFRQTDARCVTRCVSFYRCRVRECVVIVTGNGA